jgi:DNA (cytosine-5)-methyltransferase 1
LFEPEGVSRDFTPRFPAWENSSGGLEGCAGEPIRVLNDMGGAFMSVTEEITATLRAEEHGHQPVVFEPGAASSVGGHAGKAAPEPSAPMLAITSRRWRLRTIRRTEELK